MKIFKFSFTTLILLIVGLPAVCQVNKFSNLTKEQRLGLVPAYRGNVIPMKNLQVASPNIQVSPEELNKITDSKNYDASNQFHAKWPNTPKQDIVIEADLEGKNKQLSTIALDQRYLGRDGIITKASIWIMTKGTYKMVADLETEPISQRVLIKLKKAVKNPEKIKLIIHDTFKGLENDKVCIGELACLTPPVEKPAKATVTFQPNQMDGIRQGLNNYLPMTESIPEINGVIISLSNFKVTPENAAAKGNEAKLLTDGKNSGDYSEFHTPWGGMQAQEITLEADMNGKGKVLNEIILDQRALGYGGIITQASIFVMAKGKYVKVADFDADIRNGRLCISPVKKIKNPEKIKLVVEDSSTDNGNFMVCLGEMTCIAK